MDVLNYVKKMILLIIAIIIEIVILFKLPSEAKGISKLIEDLKATRELFLNRAEYHKAIAKQISTVQTEVGLSFGITSYKSRGDLPARNINYRGIVAKDPRRIKAAYEQIKLGVKIRFHEEVSYSDLTFTIVDRKIAVIGTPIQKGAPSTID